MNNKSPKLIIVYSAHCGMGVRDGDVEKVYKDLLNRIAALYGNDDYIWFANENIIHRVRLGIIRGEIDLDKIGIMYDRIQSRDDIEINDWGAIKYYPEGFCDTVSNLNEEILLTMVNRHKQARK